jgi:DNA-binding MarR family transcriptional regulator
MDEFEESLNHILVDAFNNIIKYEERSLKKLSATPVTISEAHLIEAVGSRGDDEMTVSKIATILDISKPTVTVAIQKLEGKGYIKKAPCERDGRRMIVSLTDAGKRVERAHRLFHERMVRSLSRQFAGGEKEVLLRAVTKLSDFFREKAGAGADGSASG